MHQRHSPTQEQCVSQNDLFLLVKICRCLKVPNFYNSTQAEVLTTENLGGVNIHASEAYQLGVLFTFYRK